MVDDPPPVADLVHDYVPSGCPGVRAPTCRCPTSPRCDRLGTRPCLLIDDAHPSKLRFDHGPDQASVEFVTMYGSVWRGIYGVDVDGIVVVRPDGHISFRQSSCPSPAHTVDRAVATLFASDSDTG